LCHAPLQLLPCSKSAAISSRAATRNPRPGMQNCHLALQLHSACAICTELHNKCSETSFFYRQSHLLHQVQVIMQVMNGVQLCAQNLAGTMQMMQVGAREVATGVTTASLIQWLLIILEPRILDLDIAKTRKQPAVTGITRWHHAIEHVDTSTHTCHQ